MFEFSIPGAYPPSKGKKSKGISLRVNCRHARTADNPAVTTVPPVKVNVNARQLILYLSSHKLLGKPLPLSLSKTTQLAPKLQVRSLIFEVTRHSELREFETIELIENLLIRVIHLQSCDTLSLSVV